MSPDDPYGASGGGPAAVTLGGRYRLEREIGRGGMATVFLATDLKQRRHVAVKILSPEVAGVIGAARFAREVETASRLSHPRLVPVFDSGETDDESPLPWYVMPYITGESLRARLRREGPLPVGDAITIAAAVAEALAYAHGEGVVHRDIKPENILLSGEAAVVADFGIAKALDVAAGDKLTSTGLAVGTPQYMSPEQALGGGGGQRDADARSDIYSLGVVLYEMLAGETPYGGASAQMAIARALSQPVPSLMPVRQVPPALDAIVHKALQREPADRFPTAKALLQALDAVRGGGAPATPSTLPSSYKPRRRQLAVVGGAVLVALAALFALARLTRKAPPPLERSRVAVIPFNATTNDREFDVWREGITDILSRNLDGVGSLRTVAPSQVIRFAGAETPDRATASEVGKRTGAGLAVFGRLMSVGADSVRIVASVLDVAADEVVGEAESRDAASRIDRAIDALSLELLRHLGRDRAIGPARLASIGSRSLPAIRAFVQGEAHFRRTAWDSALASYRRATEIDTTFALAYQRTGLVLAWQRLADDRLAHEMLLTAARFNHGLGYRDSALIASDSLFAALHQVEESAQRWQLTTRLTAGLRELGERFPDDPSVWRAIGEAEFHWGLDAGGSAADLIEAFERAVALDSTLGVALLHLIPLTGRFDGVEEARRVTARYLALGPSGTEADAIALAHGLLDPAATGDGQIAARLDSAPAATLFEAWAATHPIPDSAEVSLGIGRRLVEAGRGAVGTLASEAARRRFHAKALAYRGHLREAVTVSAEEITGELPLIPGVVGPAGLVPAPPAGMAQLEWARALGDASTLARVAGEGGSSAEGLTPVARGYLALIRGDTASAIRLLAAVPESTCDCYLHRLHLARLLIDRGDRDAARALLTREMRKLFGGAVSQVLWEFERARLAEADGRTKAALRSYRFVRDVWRNADPELREYVAAAEEGVRRLAGGPGRTPAPAPTAKPR